MYELSLVLCDNMSPPYKLLKSTTGKPGWIRGKRLASSDGLGIRFRSGRLGIDARLEKGSAFASHAQMARPLGFPVPIFQCATPLNTDDSVRK